MPSRLAVRSRGRMKAQRYPAPITRCLAETPSADGTRRATGGATLDPVASRTLVAAWRGLRRNWPDLASSSAVKRHPGRFGAVRPLKRLCGQRLTAASKVHPNIFDNRQAVS